MQAPLLSINMVNYNTREITLAAIRSIQKSLNIAWSFGAPNESIELVIVDNASTDGSASAIEELAHTLSFTLKIIKNDKNLGFGAGHNIAAKHSVGELLLLLNTDTVLLNNALDNLVNVFLNLNTGRPNDISKVTNLDEKVHFLGPKLLNADLTAQTSCGPYYSIPVIFAALFMQGDHLNITRYSPNTLKKVDWVSGAAFITRREYFEELEGFDTGIFMYMEEIELFKRARDRGFNVYMTPEASIVHLGSASSDKTFPTIQVFRGFQYLYKKHHSKLQQNMVQYLLILKCRLAILISKALGLKNTLLTYTEALKIVNHTL